jgi:hypothetical protein
VRLPGRDLAHLRLQRVELGVRLLDRHAGAQAADRLVVVLALPADALGVHVDRDEGISCRQPLARQPKARTEHADDRPRPSVDDDRPSDDLRIGSEPLPPAGVGDDGDLRPLAWLVGRQQRSSECRAHLQHLEQ